MYFFNVITGVCELSCDPLSKFGYIFFVRVVIGLEREKARKWSEVEQYDAFLHKLFFAKKIMSDIF